MDRAARHSSLGVHTAPGAVFLSLASAANAEEEMGMWPVYSRGG